MVGDITEQSVDAIVSLLPHVHPLDYSGRLNQAIVSKAGQGLVDYMNYKVYEPKIGQVITCPGYNMSAGHVLFAVVPKWRTDFDKQDRLLVHACRNAIEAAQDLGVRTLAFPFIGSGREGFPKKRAARLLLQALAETIGKLYDYKDFRDVYILCENEQECRIFRDRLEAMIR